MIAKVWRFLREASMMEFFSKVVYLQCPDCNSSIKRLHHRFFPQYVSKSSCLEKNILRKKSMMENVLIKLRPCSTKPAILSKTKLDRAHVRPFCKSAENTNLVTKNPPQPGLLFSCRSRVYSCNLIKKELYRKDSCEISLPSIFKQSCRHTIYRLQLYQK